MGAGRPAKPTHLKLIEDNPGKRPLPKKEPKPKAGIPTCPRHLSPEAKRLWKKVGADLDAMGVLAISDAIALELLITAYGQYRQAADYLEQAGFTYSTVTESGSEIWRPYPEVAIASDAWRRVLRILVEFGLTAASRSKVGAIGGEIGDDPAAAYLS